jgi:aminopeptidase
MTDFAACQRRFIQLLVEQGCNVQPGQQVLIFAEPSNLHLIELAAEACYARGARYVDYDVNISRLDRAHLLGASPNRLGFVPTYKAVQIDQIVDSQGAVLAFRSQDEPDLYSDFNETQQQKLNEMMVARRDAVKRYRDEGVLQRQIGWCLTGPPSPNWARKVFPELSGDQAVQALWQDIFRMTFADREDCLRLWAEHLDRLARRAQLLNDRKIRKLRFLNEQNGTDLHVELSAIANWVSGRKTTAYGIDVCLNIPTFEVFTTPDWRGTQGTVAITRPAMINGTLVEGLRLRFEKGEIVAVEAEKNGAAYEALINTAGDPTAKRLGEVALVGVDSPIFQSGRVYHHTLYDENAACHIATGMAYTVGVENGDQLSPEELDRIGFNRRAKTHQDVMISDEGTTVYGDGKEILVQGRWVPEFA